MLKKMRMEKTLIRNLTSWQSAGKQSRELDKAGDDKADQMAKNTD